MIDFALNLKNKRKNERTFLTGMNEDEIRVASQGKEMAFEIEFLTILEFPSSKTEKVGSCVGDIRLDGFMGLSDPDYSDDGGDDGVDFSHQKNFLLILCVIIFCCLCLTQGGERLLIVHVGCLHTASPSALKWTKQSTFTDLILSLNGLQKVAIGRPSDTI